MPARRGFTLIELLVVMAIIGVLVAMLLPAIQKVRASSQRLACMNNLKQIGVAMHHYQHKHDCFPPDRTYPDPKGIPWTVSLMPYIDQENLYNQFDQTRSYYHPAQPALAKETPLQLYYCPTRRSPASFPRTLTKDSDQTGTYGPRFGTVGDYAVCLGNIGSDVDYWWKQASPAADWTGTNSPFLSLRRPATSINNNLPLTRVLRVSDYADGLSNTLFVGEKHVRADQMGICYDAAAPHSNDGGYYNSDIPWYTARKAGPNHPLARSPMEDRRTAFGSWHSGVCPFLMGDGRVITLNNLISGDVLGSLASRNGGEVIGALD
ncbi:MAG: DUF1559 domain-containing protein [Gemmataceae bacterium]